MNAFLGYPKMILINLLSYSVFSFGLDDDDQVDIDTYVDGDSQSLRESLQWEVASTSPSPSDSVSTHNGKILIC